MSQHELNKPFISPTTTEETVYSVWGPKYSIKKTECSSKSSESIAFIFTGQGSAFPGMGVEFHSQPEFLERFSLSDRLAKEHKVDPPSLYIFDPDRFRVNPSPVIQNLALFTYEYAVYEMLVSRGIRPTILSSHSFGEYAALVASGVIDFESMWKIVLFREQISAKPNTLGFMLAVRAPQEHAVRALEKITVFLSNINSPTQTVFSVGPNEIDRAETLLREASLPFKRLATPQPYHSPLLSETRRRFEEFLTIQRPRFEPAKTPLVSSVTGTLLSGRELNEDIFRKIISQQMVARVDFVSQMNLLSTRAKSFIEIGPKPLLVPLIRENLGASSKSICLAIDCLGLTKKPVKTPSRPSQKSASPFFSKINTIIGKLTGYEIEKISTEDKLQEDLGIDSIKRTEIVFAVMEGANKPIDETFDFSKVKSVSDLIALAEAPIEIRAAKKTEISYPPTFSCYSRQWQSQWPSGLFQKDAITSKPVVFDKKAPDEVLSAMAASLSDDAEMVVWVNFCDIKASDDLNEIAKRDLDFASSSLKIVRDAIRIRKRPLKLFWITPFESYPLVDGLLAALLSLQKEVPHWYVKRIRLSHKAGPDEALRYAAAELGDLNQNDVWWNGRTRSIPRFVRQDFRKSQPFAPSNVFFFGGAKGIGFELTKSLSSIKAKQIFWIGRSEENAIRENLNTAKQLSLPIKYIQCDASIHEQVENVFKNVKEEISGESLIVNSVGIEKSKYLIDKNDDEIRVELASKMLPAIFISGVAKKENARQIHFSSIVSAFGNEGQSCYAFANAYIDSAANVESSIQWPPWDAVGMTANRGVLQALKSKGASLLPAKTGTTLFHDWFSQNEMLRTGLFTDPFDVALFSAGNSDASRYEPILGKIDSVPGTLEALRSLKASEPWINDHSIDKTRILPAAMGIAGFLFLGELVERTPVRLSRFRIHRPILVTGDSLSLHWKALRKENHWHLSLWDSGLAFEAETAPQEIKFAKVRVPTGVAWSRGSDLYRDGLLFHGPAFQVISKYGFVDDETLVSYIDQNNASALLTGEMSERITAWFDAGFQTMALFLALKEKRMPLPFGVDEIQCHGIVERPKELFIVAKRSGELSIVAGDGSLLFAFKGVYLR